MRLLVIQEDPSPEDIARITEALEGHAVESAAYYLFLEPAPSDVDVLLGILGREEVVGDERLA